MNKRSLLFFQLIFILTSLQLLSQSDINTACERLAKAAFENTFDKDSIERSKAFLLKSLKTIDQQKFTNCNCNDSIWALGMRDSRNFGPNKSIRTSNTNELLDTREYLQNIAIEIDYEFLIKEISFQDLERPIDTIQYVLDKLGAMIQEPNAKGVRHYNGCILGERLLVGEYKKTLVKEYFTIIRDESVQESIKDFLMLSLFSLRVEEVNLDSLVADILHPEHPLFYRICGLLRIHGGPKSTAKIMRISSNMDSQQKKFTITLPISYYKRGLISKKTMREYGTFLFENNLYPLCEKGGHQYLGEKNEKAFRRRYRKYL